MTSSEGPPTLNSPLVAPPPENFCGRPWLLSFTLSASFEVWESQVVNHVRYWKLNKNVLWRHNRSWIVYFLLHNLRWNKSAHCSVHLHCLFLNVQCNQYFKNEEFKNCLRIFKDAGKYSRTTRCFSRIKDITSFDSKFKDSSWRSRTSGNLR